MLSIFHYFSAKERLKEAQKTVYMMGGEEDCQELILAQRDIIKLEMDYYKEEMVNLLKQSGLCLVFMTISIPIYYFFFFKLT